MKLIKSKIIRKCNCCNEPIYSGYQYKLSAKKYIHFECKVKVFIVEPVVEFKLVTV